MATTSPDNLRTPNPGDPYNLVADLATLASDTQVALNKRVSNLLTGTAAQRVAATGTATAGMLWQDTDGIKMIWRKDGASWVPAVWRWSGTTAQMNAFAAPNGFVWVDTSNNGAYLRTGGSWVLTNMGRRVPLSTVMTPASGRSVSGYAIVTPGSLKLVVDVTGSVDNTSLGTLVSGYQPAREKWTQLNGAGGTGQLRIGTDRSMHVFSSASFFSFSTDYEV